MLQGRRHLLVVLHNLMLCIHWLFMTLFTLHYSVFTAFYPFCDSQRFTAVMMAMQKFEVYTVQRSRQKTFTNGWKTQILQRKLSRIAHWCCQRMPHPQILGRKQIVIKPQNSYKFSTSSSKVFRYMLIVTSQQG